MKHIVESGPASDGQTGVVAEETAAMHKPAFSPGPSSRSLETASFANPGATAPNKTPVSIILPTLDEVENIDPLLQAIFAANADLPLQILVADGGSTDGTIERVRAWEVTHPVRLIPAEGRRGLAGDVLAAARAAGQGIVVVMDADGSHPPERIGDLVRPILAESADMVVGSRYVQGGSIPDWPWPRRLLSYLGGVLAWPLTELKDPMSGFFATRQERLAAVDPTAAGFKIGLEIIAQGGDRLRLREVPIEFRDRTKGQSKIGIGQMAAYVRRLMVLAGGAVSLGNATRFAGVGMIGLLIDLVVFQVMFRLGDSLVAAHVTSFVVATVSNYLLNSRWAFASEVVPSKERDWRRYSRFLIVCILAFAIRGGVLAFLVEMLNWHPQVAILAGVGVAAVVNYLGSAFFVFPSLNPRVPPAIRWRIAAIGAVAYLLLLRLVFSGVADLLPEESYYWNYAQHLDFGYLDHPPMVAWTIWLGTAVFGDTEFGVRIGALLLWLFTGTFAFALTRDLFGKSAAFVATLLVAALPFYFATGLLMMPDTPLTAAWAGMLFFLNRALLADRPKAWWGVGLCLGLGLLSKYTIALLGPATLLFLALDSRSRRWFFRPEPYIGVVVAAVLFAPVVVWNAQHGWASFAFQSTRRIAASFTFGLPELLLAALVLLTPVGLIAAGVVLVRRGVYRPLGATAERQARVWLFSTVFTLVPLSVFVLFSLSHSIKLNWTGPVWLAVVPALAAAITVGPVAGPTWVDRVRRSWVPTLATVLVIYGLGLHYLVLGFPVTGYAGNLDTLPVAWREFGQDAAAIQRQVERHTGTPVVLIGLDKYFFASELAFYNRPDGRLAHNSIGRGAIGRDSLMYDYWYDPATLAGRTAIMFGTRRNEIEDRALGPYFARLGPIEEKMVLKEDKPAGHFFYRVGYGMKPGHPDATGEP